MKSGQFSLPTGWSLVATKAVAEAEHRLQARLADSPRALRAYERLKRACPHPWVAEILDDVARTSARAPFGPSDLLEVARTLDDAANSLARLYEDMTRSRHVLRIPGADPAEDPDPAQLRTFAEVLRRNAAHSDRRRSSPHRELIANLVHLIQRESGRAHLCDLADVLEALGIPANEDSLKQLLRRERQERERNTRTFVFPPLPNPEDYIL